MYYLSKTYRSHKVNNGMIFEITDTKDGVAERYITEDVVKILKKGIDIKGIYLNQDGSLFYHVIKPEKFSNPDAIGAVVPWDYGDIAMVIAYKSKDNFDVMLPNGAIIKHTSYPAESKPVGIEAEVILLQSIIETLRLNSRVEKNVYTFNETRALFKVSEMTLLKWYKEGLIYSYRFGVWNKYFRLTSEPMFSTKDIYSFIEKEYSRLKKIGCYTKEQLKEAIQKECGMTDTMFLRRIDKFIPAIVNSDGRGYYTQTQLDFLKVMYRREGEQLRIVSEVDVD